MSFDADRGLIKQDSDGKLVAPKAIFPNCLAARSVYEQYRTAHIKRIVLYAEIEGLIGGNPPYDPVELHKAKLDFITNYNNLDARALYKRSGQAYWNLLNQAEYLAVFSLVNDSPEAVNIQQVLAEEFDRMLRSWPSFSVQMNMATAQLVKFGVSPILWYDERDWRFRTVDLSRFYVQDQCPSDFDQVTMVFMDSVFTVQYLMQVYNQFKDKQKEQSPWNCEALAQLLLLQANTWSKTNNVNTQYSNWLDVQRQIDNGDFGWGGVFTDEIQLVSGFAKEYDGKISHYMFSRNLIESKEFLFSTIGQYTCFQEAFIVMTASPGEATLHGNRGVGHMIFAPCQAGMQLECSMLDVAKFAATPLLASSPNGPQSAEPIRWNPGVPTHIGTSEFVNNTLGGNLQPIAFVAQVIGSKLNNNLANSGDDPGIPDREEGSIAPSVARTKAFNEFNVLKGDISHFYEQGADQIYRNIYIKVLCCKKDHPGYDYVKDFKDRCLARGVPEFLFSISEAEKKAFKLPKAYNSIKATRVAGDGSQVATIMGLEGLAPIVPAMGPREQKQYKRDMVRAHLGVDQVKAYDQDRDDSDSFSGGASVATLENGAMEDGKPAQFSPDNDQRAHIAIHFAFANDVIKRVQQQQLGNLDADKIFTQLVPHLGEHIQYISQDPFNKPFFDSIRNTWKQIQDYANLTHKNAAREYQAEIKKRQELEQRQQEQLSDQSLKRDQAAADIQLKQEKQDATLQMHAQQSEARAKIQEKQVDADIENKRRKTEADVQAKRQSLVTPVENQSLPELRENLSAINGQTPSPYDVEEVKRV